MCCFVLWEIPVTGNTQCLCVCLSGGLRGGYGAKTKELEQRSMLFEMALSYTSYFSLSCSERFKHTHVHVDTHYCRSNNAELTQGSRMWSVDIPLGSHEKISNGFTHTYDKRYIVIVLYLAYCLCLGGGGGVGGLFKCGLQSVNRSSRLNCSSHNIYMNTMNQNFINKFKKRKPKFDKVHAVFIGSITLAVQLYHLYH